MSIIYDALKKSQRARTATVRPKVARLPRLRLKQAVEMLLLMTALFVIAVMLTMPIQPIHTTMMSPAPSTPVSISTAMTRAPRLMLEGVFLSDNERLAMINHHTYHEGDQINGMQIVSIAFDQVTLQNKARSVTLRSALTQLD